MKLDLYYKLSGYAQIDVSDDFDWENATEDDVADFIRWDEVLNSSVFELEDIQPSKPQGKAEP